jgi:hypothetical protein
MLAVANWIAFATAAEAIPVTYSYSPTLSVGVAAWKVSIRGDDGLTTATDGGKVEGFDAWMDGELAGIVQPALVVERMTFLLPASTLDLRIGAIPVTLSMNTSVMVGEWAFSLAPSSTSLRIQGIGASLDTMISGRLTTPSGLLDFTIPDQFWLGSLEAIS